MKERYLVKAITIKFIYAMDNKTRVDDGYIAVGSYVYEEKQLSINTRDGLIVKYDFDGNVLWSKNYQVLGDTEFKKILVLEDGFLVVGQSIYENLEIGNHDSALCVYG